jgi:hypothetical protein
LLGVWSPKKGADRATYEFAGQGPVSAIVQGMVFGRYGGPKGTRMVVGHELTFEVTGFAVRP